MTDHPLNQLDLLPDEALAALRKRWIETAEQLIATASTPEGRACLARLPGLDAGKLDDALARLEEVVGPVAKRELQQPVPGGKLGLLIPQDEHRAPPKGER